MAFIEGSVSNQLQEVDAVSLASRVTLYDKAGNTIGKKHRSKIEDTQEGLLLSGKNDDFATLIRVDRKGNIMTGNYIPELVDPFEGSTMHVQKWTATSTTFVPAQTTVGGYNFNSTSLTTANAVSVLQSQRYFYKYPRVPLQAKIRVRANIFTNSNADFGWGLPTTVTLIVPNGVCVRIINGLWYVVITFNNAEVGTPIAVLQQDGVTQFSTNVLASEFYVVDLIVDDDDAVVTVQDTGTGDLVGRCHFNVPLSSLAMWGATSLPFYARVWNASSVPATAPVFVLGYVQILSTDWATQPDASQIAGNLGMSAGRNPFTGAQLENHTNSTAPTSATLSNTAAGYSTLGGRFQFAAVAGAATDYALFAVAMPTGAKFLCEGIHIELYNTVVAVATTPTIFEWSMGFNSSAVSLATANIIRRQVGCQNFQVGAGVGACATPLDVNFITPEVVESGRFIHVILNMPVGTATATEIFRGTVLIKGRFI